MDSRLPNTCDTDASRSREKQGGKNCTTQDEEIGHSKDYTASSSDAINNTLKAKTQGECEAENYWQQLRAVKNETQEIERYKKLQKNPVSRFEAEHDGAFPELRLRVMRQKRARRDAKMSLNRTGRPGWKHDTGAVWETERSQNIRRRSAASEHQQLAESTMEDISPGQWLSKNRRQSEQVPSSILWESKALPPDSKRLSVELTDAETFAVIAPPTSPPPSTLWRDLHPQPVWLNINQDRIETHFILANKFLDDVNTMLDFIQGWPEYQFQDIAYAFEKDPENRGRITRFVNLGDQNWGVQILNPLRVESNVPRLFDSMETFEDLPIVCQQRGCDKGCPRKVPIKEKMANLQQFRLEQGGKTRLSRQTPLNVRTEKGNTASFHLGVLSKLSLPPPPTPSTPLEMDGENTMTKLPDCGDAVRSSASETSEGHPPASTILPAASQQVRDAAFYREKIKESIGKIKGHMSSKQASNVPNRDAVKEWLQKANCANRSTNSGSHDCAVDKRAFGWGGHDIQTATLDPVGIRSEVPPEHATARTVLEHSPVIKGKTKGNESPIIPQKTESITPSPKPAAISDVTLSITLETIPSRGHVKVDDDDYPHRILREQEAVPSAPSMRDDIDIEDDEIPMGYPETEPTMVTSTHASHSSDHKEVRAYQRHIKAILRTFNARSERKNTPPTSAPSRSAPRSQSGRRVLRVTRSSRSIPNNNTRPLFRAASRSRVTRSVEECKEKESGHDKKMLENLFEEL